MTITQAFQPKSNKADFKGTNWAIVGVRATIPVTRGASPPTTMDIRMDWDDEKGYHVNFVTGPPKGDREKIAFSKAGRIKTDYDTTVSRFNQATGWQNAVIGEKLESKQDLTLEEQTH